MDSAPPARADIWPLITRPDSAAPPDDPAPLRAAARRLAELLSPALAEYALRPAVARLGLSLLDGDAVAESRLHNRYVRATQIKWARVIAEAGIETVYLKGFATAHTLYAEPDVRTIGDLDVLVRERDLPRLVDLLAGRGFRFGGARLPPWGFIARGSFAPFVSRTDRCNIDLHVHPDTYPVYRSLTTEIVFAEAEAAEAEDLPIRVPSREHAFLIAATNAAKDKFGVFAPRKILDALLLLRREPPLDGARLAEIAAAGGFLKPLRVFVALLGRLGADVATLGPALGAPPGGLARAEFERLVRETEALYPETPGACARWRREVRLCAEPAVAVHNGWRRLSGLLLRRRGVPAIARE